MADEYGLATLKTTELDIVTTAATTVYVPVIVDGIPKRITLANLIGVVGGEISFLDLSDTPSAYSDGDTVQSSASAIVLTTV